MVNGKDKNITDEDFVAAGRTVSIPEAKIREYIQIIREQWKNYRKNTQKLNACI